ncbi:phosphopantothenoylcysteine decarboxylase/phosphopantothenate--cysteine ligase [Thermoplasmatales archaeon SCGC AB-539-N05]|nr:phosphopantothenoylcysteine decarboxylase/phosphopantothenate--cysteine ligase [Thermoplasmatales archaeon SCGC AB-539-N05]
MHPADEIRGEESKKLINKRIVVGVTGSIAAVETIRLCRELIRHGAEVYPVMTAAAMNILHPNSLWFATGNKPIIELTGATEHVMFCGKVKNPVDMLLISPCTANTLSKIALGIDDTPVTTFATTAIGSGIPVMIAPAMHVSMLRHEYVKNNLQACKNQGVIIAGPRIEGNKAKMVNPDEILLQVFRLLGKNDLAHKKVLIIGGPTMEAVDDIRVLTNRSSGKTAVFLARNAFERGAYVELWYGPGSESVPPCVTVKRFESTADILQILKKKSIGDFDIILVCAAIADYIPKKQVGKIPSGKQEFVLKLLPAPKIIKELRRLAPDSIMVAFKAEEKKKILMEKASAFLKNNKVDMVVANTVSGFGDKENEIWIMGKKARPIYVRSDKQLLAEKILDQVKK